MQPCQPCPTKDVTSQGWKFTEERVIQKKRVHCSKNLQVRFCTSDIHLDWPSVECVSKPRSQYSKRWQVLGGRDSDRAHSHFNEWVACDLAPL